MTKEVTITAYDIYEAAFDEACKGHYENLSLKELCKYVEEYADEVFDVILEYVTVTKLILLLALRERCEYDDADDLEYALEEVEFKTSNENAVLMKELQAIYN